MANPLTLLLPPLLPSDSKTSPAKTPKKVKVEDYKLTREQKALIKNDEANKKVWEEAMQSLSLGPVRILTCLKASTQTVNQAWNVLLIYV